MSHIQDLAGEIRWNVLILLYLLFISLFHLFVSAVISINREINNNTQHLPDRPMVHVADVYVVCVP